MMADFYYVYFLECEGFVKIGRTEPHRLAGRLRDINNACPFQTTFLGAIKSPVGLSPLNEIRVHMRFAKDHHRGEWFRLTDEIRRFLDEHRCAIECTLPPSKVPSHTFPARQSPRKAKAYYAQRL